MKVTTTEHQNIFYFSDPHYNHKNICRGVSKWPDLDKSTRPFETLEEMNDALVNGVNSIVREDDILICTGDWAFNAKSAIEYRSRIKCKNVHLIYGNHDKYIFKDKTIQGMFSSVQPYKEVRVNGEKVCLFHYKQMIWNMSHRGAYHLYGHSHSNLEHVVNGRSMDVGVDNAYKLLGEYRPFSHEEIVDLLKGRKIEIVDHHGESEGHD